jgi:tetratricopeptide (TPR) repeat protein
MDGTERVRHREEALRRVRDASVAVFLLSCVGSDLSAQQWSWPEQAENLTELPADFPPERLRAVMLGFTDALGVGCAHCHSGEEGQPLSTYDFVSDANPNKNRARAMYRLLGAVNDHLDEIEPSGEEVNMWCHTCHQGKPRPQTLAEAIGERARNEGGAAAVAHFRELRTAYYGGPGYDFRPASVGQVAFGLAEAGEADAGLELAQLNVAHHPDAWEAHAGLGDVLGQVGDSRGARAAYERALELSPDNPRITARIRSLG